MLMNVNAIHGFFIICRDFKKIGKNHGVLLYFSFCKAFISEFLLTSEIEELHFVLNYI